MSKRGTSPSSQIAFSFEPPVASTARAALAGENARVAGMVADMLHGDARSREVIAAEMSVLLAEDVSKAMIDAYASPARAEHNISHARFKALVLVTQRYDLLDVDVRTIGAALLIGEQIHLARAGHLRSQISELTKELKEAERLAKPIAGAIGGVS